MKIKNIKIAVPSLAVVYVLSLAATEIRASGFEAQSMRHAREATTFCRIDFDERLQHRELAQQYQKEADYWSRISQYLNPLYLFIHKPRQDTSVPTLDQVLRTDGQVGGMWSNLEEVAKHVGDNSQSESKQDNF